MAVAAQAENERGSLMKCRNASASIFRAWLLATVCLGLAPTTNAASLVPSFRNPSNGPGSNVIEAKDRDGVPRTYVPIAPSYRYYDYPYYTSRGYYPIHIPPGFIYYGHPYSHYARRYYQRYGGRCPYWHHRCFAYSSHGRHLEPARHYSQRLGACRCR